MAGKNLVLQKLIIGVETRVMVLGGGREQRHHYTTQLPLVLETGDQAHRLRRGGRAAPPVVRDPTTREGSLLLEWAVRTPMSRPLQLQPPHHPPRKRSSPLTVEILSTSFPSSHSEFLLMEKSLFWDFTASKDSFPIDSDLQSDHDMSPALMKRLSLLRNLPTYFHTSPALLTFPVFNQCRSTYLPRARGLLLLSLLSLFKALRSIYSSILHFSLISLSFSLKLT